MQQAGSASQQHDLSGHKRAVDERERCVLCCQTCHTRSPARAATAGRAVLHARAALPTFWHCVGLMRHHCHAATAGRAVLHVLPRSLRAACVCQKRHHFHAVAAGRAALHARPAPALLTLWAVRVPNVPPLPVAHGLLCASTHLPVSSIGHYKSNQFAPF